MAEDVVDDASRGVKAKIAVAANFSDRNWALLIVAITLAIYLPFGIHDAAQINDTRSASAAAWNLATNGTLAFPEAWPVTREIWAVEGVDGRAYSNRFPGLILFGAPFFLLQDLVSPSAHGNVHFLFVNYAAGAVAGAFATAIGMGLSFFLYRCFVAAPTAAAATLVTATATAFWSVASTALWPHGLSHALITGALLVIARRRGGTTLLICAFLIALVRPHVLLGLLPVGIWLLAKRRWSEAAWLAGGAAGGGVALSVYTRALFGTWMPVAGYSDEVLTNVVARSLADTLLYTAHSLAALDRGLFVYSSFVLLLLPFVARAVRATEGWVSAASLGAIIYLVFNARSTNLVGGSQFYSYRIYLEALSLSAPLLLVAWRDGIESSSLVHRVFLVLVAGSAALHLYGAAFATIDREVREGYLNRIPDRLEEAVEHPAIRSSLRGFG